MSRVELLHIEAAVHGDDGRYDVDVFFDDDGGRAMVDNPHGEQTTVEFELADVAREGLEAALRRACGLPAYA